MPGLPATPPEHAPVLDYDLGTAVQGSPGHVDPSAAGVHRCVGDGLRHRQNQVGDDLIIEGLRCPLADEPPYLCKGGRVGGKGAR